MKKHYGILLAGILLVTILAAVAFAQQATPTTPATCPTMSGPGMMGQGGMMMGKDGMGCPMCGAMMGRTSMVAMDDNLYVMAGHKILKYDANLNLVKETEIKWDMEGMMKMHQKMMDNCPMRQQMMPKPPAPK